MPVNVPIAMQVKMTTATTAALIVAAGQGGRAAAVMAKRYARIGGETVLTRTLSVFLHHPAVDLVMVAISEADRALYQQAAIMGHPKLAAPAIGGDTRQRSVLNGLLALQAL